MVAQCCLSQLGLARSSLRAGLLQLQPRLSSHTPWARHNSTEPDTKPVATEPDKPTGLLDSIFGMASNYASPSTNRWTMFVPAFCTHVCLGAPYGWSAISGALAREHGMVVSAATDWSLDSATYPMSVMIAFGGMSAAAFGKWTMKVCGALLHVRIVMVVLSR